MHVSGRKPAILAEHGARVRVGWPTKCIAFYGTKKGPSMKMSFFAFVAFLGLSAFSILFIADRERKAGEDRLSEYKFSDHSALDTDPDLKLMPARSPYMRTER